MKFDMTLIPIIFLHHNNAASALRLWALCLKPHVTEAAHLNDSDTIISMMFLFALLSMHMLNEKPCGWNAPLQFFYLPY